MKRLIMLQAIICLCRLSAIAQGINFETNLSWSKILHKAKQENKYIFIDAYATWCGPCKLMDKDVYTNDSIGTFVNANFVSVKIQMDKTAKDNEYVKSWYLIADSIMSQYKIIAFPSYIFLTPDGELAHRELGYKSNAKFMQLVKTASDANNNYAALTAGFIKGNLPPDKLLSFAFFTQSINNDTLALNAAKIYKQKYIDPYPAENIISPTIRLFLEKFGPLFSFKDKMVSFMYNHDSLAVLKLSSDKGYPHSFVKYVIGRDHLNPIVMPDGKLAPNDPDWNKIQKQLSKTYDKSIAAELVLDNKIYYYRSKKQWKNLIKYEFAKLDRTGVDTSMMGVLMANNFVYDVVFTHSSDLIDLKKGANIMVQLLNSSQSNYFVTDTYANVLYKLGEIAKAIKQEEKAIKEAEAHNDQKNVAGFKNTLLKMKNNEPTWPQL